MGNLAASGGYFVAAPAHKIVAQPGSVTGSIGVAGGKAGPEGPVGKALNQLGTACKPATTPGSGVPTGPLRRTAGPISSESLDRTYADFHRARSRTGAASRRRPSKSSPKVRSGAARTPWISAWWTPWAVLRKPSRLPRRAMGLAAEDQGAFADPARARRSLPHPPEGTSSAAASTALRLCVLPEASIAPARQWHRSPRCSMCWKAVGNRKSCERRH